MDTLRVVLLNMIGIKVADREQSKSNETVEVSVLEEGEDAAPITVADMDLTKLGFFDEEGKFFLKKGDHKKLFTYFKNFYIHRVQHVGAAKKAPITTEGRDSYQPKVSGKTAKLA